MWSRVASNTPRGHIRHHRIQSAAAALLVVRLLEGAACWGILCWFYAGVTVSAWAVHLSFAAYGVANVAFFFVHRRMALNAARVWLDLGANLLPMGAAAYWTGGVYSPFMPLFVVKMAAYTVVYGADVGWQSLGTTAMIALGLVVIQHVGFGRANTVGLVPLASRQHLHLAFELLAYGIMVGAALRFFRILHDHERRLAITAHEKEQLYETSMQQQAQLRRLSQRMMRVSERTMRRLARELHDDLGQALTAVKMDLGLIERQLDGDSETCSRLREARNQIGAVLQEVRHLSQLLRPAVLDDLGLVPAVQSYIARFSRRTGIPVELDSPAAETRLPRSLEVALYRVLQEVLTNVARHANAEHVNVRLDVTDQAATLQITDDGHGFDAAAFLRSPPAGHGMGVIGMQERVAGYGGQFAIESQQGAGTRVELSIPLNEPIEDLEDDHGEDPRVVD
jgi:signal transduction histidine kinase